jgi:hypothetical protein
MHKHDLPPPGRERETTPLTGGQPSQNGPPSITLPKGGGAIRGIGEKFAANPVTGTGSMSVPIATSPGRSGFGPQLSLSYDSGSGNGPFGFGWSLGLPSITRKTDKGLPQYQDASESDVFVLSGAEDLVPLAVQDPTPRVVGGASYRIQRYRPRIEGLFARIERWTNLHTGETHWRSITRDNVTTLYGKGNDSRIFHPGDREPEHPPDIFSWLICASYDDKGNAIVYEYAAENDAGIDPDLASERNRVRRANRYLKRIRYGNRSPNRDADGNATDPASIHDWLFEVLFDYDEDHYEEIDLDPTRPEAEQHRYVRASAAPERAWDAADRPWAVRPDPFSSHRSRFEVHTYRRCRRVLMFHRFDELGSEPYLVRSTEFEYADFDYTQPSTIADELAFQGSTRFASFIRAVTHAGFVRDDARAPLDRNGARYLTYLKQSLPPLEFEYSKARIQDDLRELDAESRENLPQGVDGAAYQWVDLDGEGVSGILTEQAAAWFYKPNLGDGRFGRLVRVPSVPSLADLSRGGQQLLDLAGDGQLDLVSFAGPTPGFYERTQEEGWEPFRTFRQLPNIPWEDPNLRFVDLNGDGHADVLITEHDLFTWHPSLAEEGFGAAQHVPKPRDEAEGPRLVFADGTQSIYLADMCGDGLTDLVRIRNGDVCYWPNLGYGRFCAQVTKYDAPWFDHPEQFNQQRIRLADIDGLGTNDIIYLGREGVRLYFNQSGNRWSGPRSLGQFPPADNLSSVLTTDLLGNGTACLVWSSPLPGDARRPMRYIDLMGGQKPHLLIRSVNNLGAETRVHYAPATKFYLADKLAGTPWITRIPFPVHVVERVETYDHVGRNRFVTRYAYHHGYFDGIEREFRGFGMIEQWDTEAFAALSASPTLPAGDNIDEASHVPPVLTRTWFHTGAFLEGSRISRQFEDEYHRESDFSEGVAGLTGEHLRAMLLADTELPDTLLQADGARVAYLLSTEEAREACRALKGSILRQEVYALDGTEEEDRPYTLSERNYTIELLQPRGSNRHAVFFTHPRETVDFRYERKLFFVSNGEIRDETAVADPGVKRLADPRVTHALTLDADVYGNVLLSAAVAYGRRFADPDPVLQPEGRQKQKQTFVTFTVNAFTHPILADDDYRTPLPCETRTFELLNARNASGISPSEITRLFRFQEIVERISEASAPQREITYEDVAGVGVTGSGAFRRLIEHVRTLYRTDDLAASG